MRHRPQIVKIKFADATKFWIRPKCPQNSAISPLVSLLLKSKKKKKKKKHFGSSLLRMKINMTIYIVDKSTAGRTNIVKTASVLERYSIDCSKKGKKKLQIEGK